MKYLASWETNKSVNGIIKVTIIVEAQEELSPRRLNQLSRTAIDRGFERVNEITLEEMRKREKRSL